MHLFPIYMANVCVLQLWQLRSSVCVAVSRIRACVSMVTALAVGLPGTRAVLVPLLKQHANTAETRATGHSPHLAPKHST